MSYDADELLRRHFWEYMRHVTIEKKMFLFVQIFSIPVPRSPLVQKLVASPTLSRAVAALCTFPITKLISIIDFFFIWLDHDRQKDVELAKHHFLRRLFGQRLFQEVFSEVPYTSSTTTLSLAAKARSARGVEKFFHVPDLEHFLWRQFGGRSIHPCTKFL